MAKDIAYDIIRTLPEQPSYGHKCYTVGIEVAALRDYAEMKVREVASVEMEKSDFRAALFVLDAEGKITVDPATDDDNNRKMVRFNKPADILEKFRHDPGSH